MPYYEAWLEVVEHFDDGVYLGGQRCGLNVSQRRQSSVDEQPERKYFYVNGSQHGVSVT